MWFGKNAFFNKNNAKPDKYIASEHLTKFEVAIISGLRFKYISQIAPILEGPEYLKDLVLIAKKLRKQKNPFIIHRILPGGSH